MTINSAKYVQLLWELLSFWYYLHKLFYPQKLNISKKDTMSKH